MALQVIKMGGVKTGMFKEQIKQLLIPLLLLCAPTIAFAGAVEGYAAVERGDYETAYNEFTELALEGDTNAMIQIGLWYHQGKVLRQSYKRAMDWYIGAFSRGNGDAYNNIGVLYRDGLGVEQNRSISYALFLVTHLRGLGTQSTQHRANRNLRREAVETNMDQRTLAVCFTEPYLEAFVMSRGKLRGVPERYLPTEKQPRIRDNDLLWLPNEQQAMNIECPPPWD